MKHIWIFSTCNLSKTAILSRTGSRFEFWRSWLGHHWCSWLLPWSGAPNFFQNWEVWLYICHIFVIWQMLKIGHFWSFEATFFSEQQLYRFQMTKIKHFIASRLWARRPQANLAPSARDQTPKNLGTCNKLHKIDHAVNGKHWQTFVFSSKQLDTYLVTWYVNFNEDEFFVSMKFVNHSQAADESLPDPERAGLVVARFPKISPNRRHVWLNKWKNMIKPEEDAFSSWASSFLLDMCCSFIKLPQKLFPHRKIEYVYLQWETLLQMVNVDLPFPWAPESSLSSTKTWCNPNSNVYCWWRSNEKRERTQRPIELRHSCVGSRQGFLRLRKWRQTADT